MYYKEKYIASFKSFSDRNPATVSLSMLRHWNSDPCSNVYKYTTLSRMARVEGDKDTADRNKRKTGSVIPSGIFAGGSDISCLQSLTCIGLGDFDHIPSERMASIVTTIQQDEHTAFEYITNSEAGARVFFNWIAVDQNGRTVPHELFVWDREHESHADFLSRVLPYHDAAFKIGNTYYSMLIDMPWDTQTSNVNRRSFLAYDPNTYLNLNASPFIITPDEVEQHKGIIKDSAHIPNPSVVRTDFIRVHNVGNATNVFDLVEKWVSKNTVYASGSYNRYVSRCGYLLCEFGVPEEIAIRWAVGNFSDYNSAKVTSIIRSCYRNTSFGTRIFINNTTNYVRF